jgi:hypothetical protein
MQFRNIRAHFLLLQPCKCFGLFLPYIESSVILVLNCTVLHFVIKVKFVCGFKNSSSNLFKIQSSRIEFLTVLQHVVRLSN